MWRPSRQVLRFSLRAFLVVATLVACWFGWHAGRVRDQRRAVELVERLGGHAGYDYERIAAEERRRNPPPPPPGPLPAADRVIQLDSRPPAPAWLVALTGKHWWATVERVSLSRQDLSTADVDILSRLPSLELLNLAECRLRNANLRAWGDLAALKGLFVWGCDLDDDQLAFVARLPRVQFVEITKSSFGDAGLAHLRGLPLRRLDISETKVTDAGLAHLSGMQTLERLFANGTQIRGPGLEQLSGLPALTSLELRQTPIAAEGLEHLAALPALMYLELDSTQVNDEGVLRLAAVRSLKDLGLAETPVQGHTLAALRNLPQLERLQLNATPLSDVTVGNLSGLQNLTKLDIPWNNITDSGLARLTNLPRLRWINLNKTPITDQGLVQLSRFPALADVIVFDCPQLTHSGVNALKRALPRVSVGSNALLAKANP